MESLAKNMNFKLDIQPPPNGGMWGENKNGTFTGLVGELQKDISDIGWAYLWMLPERLYNCYLYSFYFLVQGRSILISLIPMSWNMSALCLQNLRLFLKYFNIEIFQVILTFSFQWRAIMYPLQNEAWLALFVTFLSVTLFLALITRAHWNQDPKFEVVDC